MGESGGDKGETHSLINIESMLIVLGYGFSFSSTPWFMLFIPSETDVRYYQYKPEASHDTHSYQYHKVTFISIRFIQIFVSLVTKQKKTKTLLHLFRLKHTA